MCPLKLFASDIEPLIDIYSKFLSDDDLISVFTDVVKQKKCSNHVCKTRKNK